MRILIRVPEAYLLVRAYETTRPGLLVCDADFRRVDSIALSGADPAEVARRLARGATAVARERFLLSVEGDSPLEPTRAALSRLPGVLSVSAAGRYLAGWVEAGRMQPGRLVALAAAKGKTRLLDPVPLRLVPGKQAGLAALAGAWYSAESGELHVSRFLLDLDRLAAAAPGAAVDATALRFRFTKLPKGGGGARVAAAPLRLPGVLAVVPDVFADRMTVLVRKGRVKSAQLVAAFAEAGGEARPVDAGGGSR